MSEYHQILPLIPNPSSLNLLEGSFNFSSSTKLYFNLEDQELSKIAEIFFTQVQLATTILMAVKIFMPPENSNGIHLQLDDKFFHLGEEGYQININVNQVEISAPDYAGLFWGLQTFLQLIAGCGEDKYGLWNIPCMKIEDRPRYPWRGMMLDVARHFFTLQEIKRVIDWIAYYKINRLHLHLSDDQGWRIHIDSWPKLTEIGGSTCVGGGPGGFYTQEEYVELVAYAQQRYITVIPEIDLPGHTHAALASYSELNCDGELRELYTGTEVGFSSLCIEKEVTDQFVDDVIRELAIITPGNYIHIGGDEAKVTPTSEYIEFITRLEKIVQKNGKQMVGWQEVLKSPGLSGDSIVQYWNPFDEIVGLQEVNVVLSPANKIYMDMQYYPGFPLGLDWAGHVTTKDAYEWDPQTLLSNLNDERILGVEAPLWSETVKTIDDIAMMLFPRLPGVAEIGWSSHKPRNWDSYRQRLARQKIWWGVMGINYFCSELVDWD